MEKTLEGVGIPPIGSLLRRSPAKRGCRKSLIITHKSGRLRAHPFAQFLIVAQAATQWRVRALYICDICAAQAQHDVLIEQKKKCP
ncbi:MULTISPECIES: hypothetical protein [unclassified Undibacterium]|uniref:hypothetical protein n=1 Tax=unclassified Undibacterium TaxID=2630295 RepID=UPI002AC9D80E|nr:MULTISPECIES: hypothetical protein [unclassified Undibacterium]MEB0138036.1 hypothetical protein [Undibacterium sp. CCC2.1]MEB0171226.1 hypothetical protein [Undibacterium sp. CCC1.1]MEB0175271.1 hypothetical protein [Undibacterium sp. CCC3.4]MEB0214679.1 hypothetical protein [Undibacterium sp. 5I2]WPX42446.1 hypothetical protein RHM61_13710 [Undibacterium sp. CCC3.4]